VCNPKRANEARAGRRHPARPIVRNEETVSERWRGLQVAVRRMMRARVIVALALAVAGYALWRHPPVEQVAHDEAGVRFNRWTGGSARVGEGLAVVVPGLHELRRYSLRDRTWRPTGLRRANGEAPLQSSEGMSLGAEITLRYALDPQRVAALAAGGLEGLEDDVLAPVAQGVIYKVFARYTVREIFSTKRQELQEAIAAELGPRLAREGLLLRDLHMGNVDLPPDYRAGMDRLLAVELETQQMQYTLQLKEKQVKQSELEAEADRVRREKAAQAAADEQLIAARAQEEAMKHVLPFKQKQIEQRKLEAEAERTSRIELAQGTAEARRIEAQGEADSRQKLADAEAYRLEKLGQVTSEQLVRDGDVVTRYPLLIQKTMVDKLSDKISVIIAPPPGDGGFVGANLLGQAGAGEAR
jgi:regulator of protease activity HflC (stomatin/prohibitin superfamily)